MFDWDDIRHFLAVARTGSTLAAAKSLGVNQTTCARRIEALEAALGQRLFDATRSGRTLTEAGQALVPCAEAMETAARQVCDQAATHTRGLTGSLRLTSSEVLANLWLAPAMGEFRQQYPDIDLELITADRFLDLAAGEADIAIRASIQPTDPGCVVRKLTVAPWAIFCSVDYADKHGRPADPEGLNEHMLIGGVGEIANLPAMRWLAEAAPRGRIHCRSNSLQNLYYSVKAGLGIAPLPTTMGDNDPALVRCSTNIKELEASVWLITPERLRDTPRVRAFIDFVVPYMARNRVAHTPEAANGLRMVREPSIT